MIDREARHIKERSQQLEQLWPKLCDLLCCRQASPFPDHRQVHSSYCTNWPIIVVRLGCISGGVVHRDSGTSYTPLHRVAITWYRITAGHYTKINHQMPCSQSRHLLLTYYKRDAPVPLVAKTTDQCFNNRS